MDKHFYRIIVFFFLLISLINCLPVNMKTSSSSSSPPLLLLISFDGFRWDYPDIYKLPHFNAILKRGVRVKHIDNSFATVTFPSHFTIITGLYEETHGIVANEIYDPILNEVATLGTMNDPKWWTQNPYSQPMWITNELANDSYQRRSGVIAWPGSNVLINGHLPNKHEDYTSNRPFNSTLNKVLSWFHEPIDTRINFGAVYHYQPDDYGHRYGPISPEVNQTLQECDDYIGKLLQIIDNDEYLKTNLNVIITSDHGMHDVDSKQRIILENYIDKSLFSAYGGRTFVNIFVKNNKSIDQIYANLSVIPNYEVYKKNQIPDVYHYKNNVRIGDILMIGKVGYEIAKTAKDGPNNNLGEHGYDNRAESMHPIFYAFGPAFRRNLLAEPFRNVDIYPLMSYILRLNQRATNGSLENVKHILIDFQMGIFAKILVLICIIMVVLMGIIFTICACRHSRQLIYIPPDNNEPIQYRLLGMDDGSTNNFVGSESEEEVEGEQKI